MNYILIIFNFASLVLIPLGLVGNTLMFIVYTTQKRLKRLSVSIYFRIMAIINLYITLNWIKIFLIKQYNYYIANQSAFLCKSVYYLIYWTGPMSSWLCVLVSVDSFLKIAFPNRFQNLHKLKNQLIIIALALIYNMAYYFFMLFDFNFKAVSSQPLSHIENNHTNTSGSDSSPSKIYKCLPSNELLLFWLDLINSALLPFIFRLVLSLFSILVIVKSRQTLMISAETTNADAINKSRRQRDIKFGLTTIFLNLVFFVLNAPNPFYSAVTFFLDINPELANMLDMLFLAFYYAYYALIFYLQLIVNNVVREELLKCILLLKKVDKSAKHLNGRRVGE
jgi:hypothetical protein